MPEFRWNPLLDTWTMVATNRQNRPYLPKDYCPFCPGSNNIPAKYDVLAYPNDFPVMSLDLPISKTAKNQKGIFRKADAVGKCEVILYSSNHNKKFYDLSDAHLLKIVELWSERFKEISKDNRVKYIFEFENKGEEVGVTIHHPHGQLYAYSFIPVKIRVFVVNKALKGNITQFTLTEKKDLAEILKKITAGFDKIFDRPFPYMMCFHQTPVNEKKYADAENYYAFHIEFYPPLRDKDKIKWYSGSESGAGAAANPLDVDACAQILKSKIKP